MTKVELVNKIIDEGNRLTYEEFLKIGPSDFVFELFSGLIEKRFIEETEDGVYVLRCERAQLTFFVNTLFDDGKIKNADELDRGATLSIRLENPTTDGFDAEVSSLSCFKDLLAEMLKAGRNEQLEKIMLYPHMMNSFKSVSEVDEGRSVFILENGGKNVVVGFEQKFKDVPELRDMFSFSEKPVFLVTICTSFGFF